MRRRARATSPLRSTRRAAEAQRTSPARAMAPPPVERALAAFVAALDEGRGAFTREIWRAFVKLRAACEAHGGAWQVDPGKLAALAARVGGPQPVIGISCLALAQLAASDGPVARA